MAKHFAVEIRDDGHFAFQRRTQQIEQEARLDGIYVIRTSVPAEQLDANETVQAYKDLSRVEYLPQPEDRRSRYPPDPAIGPHRGCAARLPVHARLSCRMASARRPGTAVVP